MDTMNLENVTEEVHEPMNVKVDPTNPDYYKIHTSFECIEEMELMFNFHAVIDFCVCNAWKYMRRWKNKNGIEDLKKAKWYIEKTWELFDENFAISEKKKYSDILIRMGDYVDKWIKESKE